MGHAYPKPVVPALRPYRPIEIIAFSASRRGGRNHFRDSRRSFGVDGEADGFSFGEVRRSLCQLRKPLAAMGAIRVQKNDHQIAFLLVVPRPDDPALGASRRHGSAPRALEETLRDAVADLRARKIL